MRNPFRFTLEDERDYEENQEIEGYHTQEHNGWVAGSMGRMYERMANPEPESGTETGGDPDADLEVNALGESTEVQVSGSEVGTSGESGTGSVNGEGGPAGDFSACAFFSGTCGNF
jgi:hypothetical protein